MRPEDDTEEDGKILFLCMGIAGNCTGEVTVAVGVT
jgi:hypothetical protein